MKVVYWWRLSIDESCFLMKVVYWWELSIDESYLLMNVVYWWKLSSDGSCLLMKVIIVKEVISCDVSPVAMFTTYISLIHFHPLKSVLIHFHLPSSIFIHFYPISSTFFCYRPFHPQSHLMWHLFNFSSVCVFKCLLKWPARDNSWLHWLHLFDFTPLWVYKCVAKLLIWKNT